MIKEKLMRDNCNLVLKDGQRHQNGGRSKMKKLKKGKIFYLSSTFNLIDLHAYHWPWGPNCLPKNYLQGGRRTLKIWLRSVYGVKSYFTL